MQNLKFHSNRLDAAPTEVQMKLAIAQVLSLPFAYNARVIVLDFDVTADNVIKGRFKDASRPRVFAFEIGDSVSFKPFTWKRTDSTVDPVAWEDFSKGYTYRYDAVKTTRKEKPKCGNTSYNCGKACIGLNKNCKSDPPDKPSQEKIDKVRAMGGEFKQTKSDPTKAQENNKLTPKPPEEVIEPYNRNNAPSKSTPDSDIAKRVIADIEKVKSGQVLLNEKERYRLQYDRGMYLLNDPKLSARQGGTSKKLTEKEATDFLSEQYEKGETKYTPDRSQLGGVGHKFFIDSNTPEGKALLEAEELVKKTKKTSSDHRVAVDLKNVATIDYIAKRSANSPTKEQQEYDNKQPDKIELEKGAGLSEGWRSENAKRRYAGKSEDITAYNDVTGIPWKVTSSNGREDVVVGAKVSDSYDGKERQLTLHKSDGTMSFIPFAKNDKEKENRAKRLVKEIAQGKSRNINIDEISSMIDSGKQTKPTPNSTGESGKAITKSESKPTPGKTLDLNDLWQQTADAARSNNQEAASKHLEKWREVVSKLESGEGISKDISLREYQNLMDNLERDLTLGNNKTNAEFKKITKPISRILDKANSLNPLTPEDLEKAHPNFRPTMKRMHETLSKYFELGDKKDSAKKELDRLKQERSYNEAVILNNSKQFRETSIDNNYNELKSLARRNPNDLIQVKNPVSNLPERTVSVPKRIDEINKDIRDLADDKKAQKATDRAREAIARLQNPISDAENKVSSIERDRKTLRDSRGEIKSTPNSSGESGKAIAKTPKTPKPRTGTKEYDSWLESESQKLEGRDGSYTIKTRSGDEVANGKIYGGLGINKNKGSLFDTYSVTHIGSGRSLGDFDDESQAKKALVELDRSGVNWDEQDLMKIPGIEKKIVKVKGLIDNVKDSDLRVKRKAKQKIIDEKTAKSNAKLEADMQRFKEEEAKKKQQAEVNRKIQEEKDKEERQKQAELERELARKQAKVYQDYEINRTNQLIGQLKSEFDIKSLESEVGTLEARLKIESSPKAKKELKQRLNNANIKLKEVKVFLSQDKLETYPAFLESQVKGMANTVGIEKTREILQEQIDNHNKQANTEHRDKLLSHLESNISGLNLSDDGAKKALVSEVFKEVKQNPVNDPDNYLANPDSLNKLVAAYLIDKPEPSKFESHRREQSSELNVKKMATDAFWHFKDKKLVPTG